MSFEEKVGEEINFKKRKLVQYSLIICVLLIQVLIASYFYLEFKNNKEKEIVNNQLKSVHSIEKLTGTARNNLFVAQQYLQKYQKTSDNKFLNLYFTTLNQFNGNLENIDSLEENNPKSDNKKINLKRFIDSTKTLSNQSIQKDKTEIPNLKDYNPKFDVSTLEIKTKTFSDTVKKKGFFGRLKDAVTGDVSLKKDSTVITISENEAKRKKKIQHTMDSLLLTIKQHYTQEVVTIRTHAVQNRNENNSFHDNQDKFYSAFNDLFVYSNSLMNEYDQATKDSKDKLLKEIEIQNSNSSKFRNYLLWGLLLLMFLVSLLILFFTRIAFDYEEKLNAANKEIQENLSFKNRILGMLSHELRSPLKIIGLFINRINKKTDDPTIKEYLKSISFTNDSLLIQSNQILEYTRNQQVENKIIPVIFNVKEEICSILTAIQPYIESRNNLLEIHKDIAPDLVVFSDKTKVHQVFINILTNANKFTENGKITVDTKAEMLDNETVLLKTKIQDTGAGVSQEDLKNIFEPYYKGVISEEVDNLGAGLGLSLCKEIISLFSGEITVNSELKQGTTVSFSFHFKMKQ